MDAHFHNYSDVVRVVNDKRLGEAANRQMRRRNNQTHNEKT